MNMPDVWQIIITIIGWAVIFGGGYAALRNWQGRVDTWHQEDQKRFNAMLKNCEDHEEAISQYRADIGKLQSTSENNKNQIKEITGEVNQLEQNMAALQTDVVNQSRRLNRIEDQENSSQKDIIGHERRLGR